MIRRYRSHWSDNRNQLGEPDAVRIKDEQWSEPWVYFLASSAKEARERVVHFNGLLRPTDSPQPAHLPSRLLAKYGFQVFPAGPLREIDPEYLAV